MKTENFDDAIRRKIESISPQYDEKDIDRTLDYVTDKRAKTSRRRYGAIVLASVVGLTMVGLLTWNLSEQKKQKQLVETIDSLKNKLASREPGTSSVKDTIYVTKYLSESNSAKQSGSEQSKNEGEIPNESGLVASNDLSPKNRDAGHSTAIVIAKNNGSASRSNQEAILVDKGSSSSSKAVSNDHQQHNSKASLPAVEKNTGGNEQSENIVASSQTRDSGSNMAANENSAEKKSMVEQNQETVIAKDSQMNADAKENASQSSPAFTLNQGAASAKGETQSSRDPRNDIQPVAKHDSSVALNPEASAQTNSTDTLSSQKAKNHQWFAFLKNWYYQAGLGYKMADGLSGYSIVGETYFNRKWSASLGIQVTKMRNENYDNDNDFHNQKGKHFYEVYGSESPDTSAYSHIEIHTTLLQIPLMLSYHIPLTDWGALQLLAGAGTEMDLVAKQHVGYDHHENSSGVTPKSIEASRATILFNNGQLTAGVQSQWKHLVAQVTPFINEQFVSVPYKKNDLYFGVGTRLMYAF